ncbi:MULTISPECIES: PfkB family carbohydrate kinase [Mesotoga]|uniref:PfkB family carbohydrate kinase n=1 Tax=Mesotoga TaxID=1184396 RepID=UPI002595B62B|nr:MULTISPECIES: PfkB family carbohydrate kinase [Mesotoga]HPE53132.1 PfkB family carbohydrate kinase [Mesotoga prima]HRX65504.1 PfkB family carbohydrate kinase [Mesotoga sp.]
MNQAWERKARVLVVGDVFLDKYVYYDPNLSRPSLETGLMTITGVREEYSPGAAGNVAKNLATLDGKVILLAPVGLDARAVELERELDRYGICTQFLVKSERQVTPLYMKFINALTGKEDLPRLDIPPAGLVEENRRKIVEMLEFLVPQVDAIIVQDQSEIPGTGCIDEEVRKKLIVLRKLFPEKLFVADSRNWLEAFSGFLLKPNLGEFSQILERAGLVDDNNRCPDQILVQKHLAEVSKLVGSPVVVTASEDGSFCFNNGILNRIFNLEGEVRDVCGAGDAFIAALTLELCGKKVSLLDSAKTATKAASLCVSQKGTGVLLRESISKLEEPNAYRVEDPSIFRNTRRLPGKTRYVLFDFDGTISLLREGWQPIMRDLMIHFITGDREIEEETRKKIKEEVNDFIAETTGLQTILQMEGLQRLVIDYGFVSEKEILTPHQYKQVYTGHLKEIVRKRINEDSRDRYLVCGSLEFLKSLHERGITLLVASGTDLEDVIEESKYLGVYDFMGGGVYGALSSFEEYSKKKVIQRLLTDRKLQPDELIVIGDGPVEISVGKEAGAFTIGVASDERKGFGWNKEKFNRLKRAGADVLIPDFSPLSALIELIFP